MHVDWDDIDHGYRENPPVAAGLSLGSKSPTTTAVPPIYVPYDVATVAEKPNEALRARPQALDDSNLVKPDVDENIPKITKPDNSNNSRSIDGLL